MKIEKLSISKINQYKNSEDNYKSFIDHFSKINELIDALSETEKNRSEQMARMIEKIRTLEKDVARIGDHAFNEEIKILKDERNTFERMAKEFFTSFMKKEEKELKILLACPFCGSHRDEIEYAFNYEGDHVLVCDTCKGRGPLKKSEIEAIKAWNKRA